MDALKIEFLSETGDVAALTDLVNEVYAAAEEGLWIDGTTRTTTRELTELVETGHVELRYDFLPVRAVVLGEWYARLGYREVRKESLAATYPHLAPRLTCPCDHVVYHKELA